MTAPSTVLRLLKDASPENISAGMLAALFGWVGSTLVIVDAGQRAGLSEQAIVSWVAGVWFFGGLMGVVTALWTRMPIGGAWSIQAAVLVGTTLESFTMPQAVGAYCASGVLVLLLGALGVLHRVTRLLPMPIVMAMVAGALMRYATGVFTGMVDMPMVVVPVVLAYFVARRVSARISPVLPAVLVGCVATWLTGTELTVNAPMIFIAPTLYTPEFSVGALVAIALPMAILVVGGDNAQAIGVLMSEGYTPPVNRLAVLSGAASVLGSFFGAHNVNVAGPITAICCSDTAGADKAKRYVSAVVAGVLCLLFGLFFSYAMHLIKLAPAPMVTTIAGLAMFGVVLQALQMAFNVKARFQSGAFVAFAIAMSGVSVGGISAPFWSLVGGVLVTAITE